VKLEGPLLRPLSHLAHQNFWVTAMGRGVLRERAPQISRKAEMPADGL
jgi:hypothetical protein